ncbi:MAG TPA: class I SAM-dependent methyltransferase [Micromonosporaceae bacterium]|jgi:methyltransferase (TIGR00027 family)
MDAGRASRTAVLVCQGRAAAHGRVAVGRFADPVAERLLNEDERRAVRWVREGQAPRDWNQRVAYEAVRASAAVIVPRTVAIDDALRSRLGAQVVILGAGLDARAWRLPELASVDVFEVDHPASQGDKQTRINGLATTARLVRFVPVDFTRQRLDEQLTSAGHRADRATTWIWEGVVPYLSRADVLATLQSVGARSAGGSRLIVNYQAPSAVATLGRLLARGMYGVGRTRSPWANEPIRSTWRPAELAASMRRYGFDVVADDDLLTHAARLNLPVHQRRSLATGRVAVADH